jgi:uncharacterized protein YjgD (DUF1641 family)
MSGSELTALQEELAAIRATLGEVSGELREMRRQREEWRELRDDMMPLARELMHSTMEELEGVAPFVGTGDFVRLFKMLLRNTNNIVHLLEMLESARGFIEDAAPLGKEVFAGLLVHLDGLDRKGYFAFGRELVSITDEVVTHFSVQDIRDLAAAIVPILETVKSMSQPKVLRAMQSAATLFESMDESNIEEYSLWRAFRERNTPEMRRGLGLLMAFVKKFGGELGMEMASTGDEGASTGPGETNGTIAKMTP